MVNILKYKQLKKLGNISLSRVGGAVVLEKKFFDEETGLELAGQAENMELADLEKQKTRLVAALDGIKTLISDVKGVKA